MTHIPECIKNEFQGWKKTEIAWLIVSISVILFLSLNKDSLLSIIAALTGCLAAIFTGQGKLGAFFFGFINSILYGYISYKYQYYGEVMVKLIVFIPLNIYGFFYWLKHFNYKTHETEKRHLSRKQLLLLIIGLLLASIFYGLGLKLLNGQQPFYDGLSTILATTALLLCIMRFCEHWILWIAINCINIYLWIVPFIDGRGKPIAILLMWCFYLINSIIMYYRWQAREKEQHK
jgi:nicotinamide mononucleotide transporter